MPTGLAALRLYPSLMILSSCMLGACNSDLPASTLVSPFNSQCAIVNISPAEELPRLPDGSGGTGERRALMRYEADCKPDVGNPSAWHLPYRLQFQEIFTKTKMYPGGFYIWQSGGREFYYDQDATKIEMDSSADNMGKNCLVLLNQLSSTTLPCISSIDHALGERIHSTFDTFKSQSTYPFLAQNQTDLNAKLLGRDERCLQYWHQVQHQLDNRFSNCLTK